MNFQHIASELNEEDKAEAEKIARRLFGVYDWQGMLNQVEGKAGLANYINRAVMRKIRPTGCKWLVGETQYLEQGWKSTYWIKSL